MQAVLAHKSNFLLAQPITAATGDSRTGCASCVLIPPMTMVGWVLNNIIRARSLDVRALYRFHVPVVWARACHYSIFVEQNSVVLKLRGVCVLKKETLANYIARLRWWILAHLP
jgi:hypothetical protein